MAIAKCTAKMANDWGPTGPARSVGVEAARVGKRRWLGRLAHSTLTPKHHPLDSFDRRTLPSPPRLQARVDAPTLTIAIVTTRQRIRSSLRLGPSKAPLRTDFYRSDQVHQSNGRIPLAIDRRQALPSRVPAIDTSRCSVLIATSLPSPGSRYLLRSARIVSQ